MTDKTTARGVNTGGGAGVNGNAAGGYSPLYGTTPGAGRQGLARAVYASNGKVVGQVRDAVFTKHVTGSVHRLRRPRAWAFDCESLRTAELLGATRVAVLDTELGVTYTATLGTIRAKGFALDRGHGAQWALCLPFWRVTGGDPGATAQLALLVGRL